MKSIRSMAGDQGSFTGSTVSEGAVWLETEQALLRQGIPLAFPHRWAWAQANGRTQDRLLRCFERGGARDGDGRLAGAIAVQMDRSRALPGHRLLRVRRFGHGLPVRSREPLIAQLVRFARAEGRVLRLGVDVFCRDGREEIAAILEGYGFRKLEEPRSYRYTLTLDLRPEEEAILAGMHKTGRKNVRDAEKSEVCVRPLVDGMYAERLAELQRDALERTGGSSERLDFAALLQMSREYPDLSRVVGIFPTQEACAPGDLAGFAWGCMHGDHAEYRAAGTARLADRKVSISYPLLWDLMRWAKREGGTWFDLGGVTVDTENADPLQGLSDFKRYFSRTVEEVGESWVLEPHPQRARVADLIGRLVRAGRGLAPRWRSATGGESVRHGGEREA